MNDEELHNWRQLFLESAGTIDIDEEAVDSLRKSSMIYELEDGSITIA